MRCWYCGVEPDQLIEVTTFGDVEPRYMANWPAGDHEHSETPPSPGELLAAGARSFDRLMAAWSA